MAINRQEVVEMLARAKEEWKLELEPDPADPLITRITADKLLEEKLGDIKEQLAELESQCGNHPEDGGDEGR